LNNKALRVTLTQLGAMATPTTTRITFQPRLGQACGKFWSKWQVIHREMHRRLFIQIPGTSKKQRRPHALTAAKSLILKNIKHLSTQKWNPYLLLLCIYRINNKE
jgi:hypothetical protein